MVAYLDGLAMYLVGASSVIPENGGAPGNVLGKGRQIGFP